MQLSQGLKKALVRALRQADLSELERELLEFEQTIVKTANYTVTAEDNNKHFIADGVVTFTLPVKSLGLRFRFTQHANSNMVISGSGIIHKNNNNASSVTFSTAAQLIGSQVFVECIDVNGTLKWVVTNVGDTTATVA